MKNEQDRLQDDQDRPKDEQDRLKDEQDRLQDDQDRLQEDFLCIIHYELCKRRGDVYVRIKKRHFESHKKYS